MTRLKLDEPGYTCTRDPQFTDIVLSGAAHLAKGEGAFNRVQVNVLRDDFGLWKCDPPILDVSTARRHYEQCDPCKDVYEKEFADAYVCAESGMTDRDLYAAGLAAFGNYQLGKPHRLDQVLRAYRYVDITDIIRRNNVAEDEENVKTARIANRMDIKVGECIMTPEQIKEESETFCRREMLYVSDHAEHCDPCNPHFKRGTREAHIELLEGTKPTTEEDGALIQEALRNLKQGGIK